MASHYRVVLGRSLEHENDGTGRRVLALQGTTGTVVGFAVDCLLVSLPAIVADVDNQGEAHGADVTFTVDPDDLTFDSIG